MTGPEIVDCECVDVDPWVGLHTWPECPLFNGPETPAVAS
jgi:hypothetical protein